MATRPYILNGLKVNILKDWRLNPLTTAERAALGATLDNRHTGLPVYDTQTHSLWIWSGTSWQPANTSAGGGGGGSSTLRIYNETLSGANNGINLIFTTSTDFIAATTVVTVNGITQKPGAGNDYLESGSNEITFLNLLPANANLLISYDITL